MIVDHPLGGDLVGRCDEMRRLAAVLSQVLSGRGHILMLAGEAGIGKTRTACEFVSRPTASAARVLVGRCHDGEGAPPYWPWIQLIRAYAGACEAEALRTAMGAAAPVIAQVVEDLHQWLGDLVPPAPLEPHRARFRLFDAVTSFYKNAAGSRALVLLLDDVHSMDRASLLLLEFVARQIHDQPILVIGTFRDTEVGKDHPLTETLTELHRLQHFERLDLRGLDPADVGRLMQQVGGVRPSQMLVDRIHRETAGNPLFVCEMVRLLASEDRLTLAEDLPSRLVLPQEIRHVIGQRLHRLSPECRRLLALAAVVGSDFSEAILRRVSALDVVAVLNAMDEAVVARVVAAVPDVPGRYTFSHGLVRETLYDDLATAERVQLHRRIAEVLEELYADDADEHAGELAHHFFEAAQTGVAAQAVAYAERAGERAMRMFAHEEAVAHYRRALTALELGGARDEGRRCAILVALGESLDRAGDALGARETLLRAAESARKLGASEMLARVALAYGLGRRYFQFGKADAVSLGLLEEALEAVAGRTDSLRVRLLSRLAELRVPAESERARTLCQEALERARALAEEPCILDALLAWHYVCWEPRNTEARVAIAEEALRLASRLGDHEAAMVARNSLLGDLLELGDLRRFDAELAEYQRLVEQTGEPFWRFTAANLQAMRALVRGQLDEGERLTEQAFALGQGPSFADALLAYGGHLILLRWAQGRLAEIEGMIGSLAKDYPLMRSVDWCRPRILSEIGRRREAAQELERIAANDFLDLPRNSMWLMGMAMAGDACAELDDTRRAEQAYELLLPCGDRLATPPFGSTCCGPVARVLGRLATTLRRWDEAEEHFSRAIRLCVRTELHLFVPLTEFDQATMLLARGGEGDVDNARALLLRARDEAERLAIRGLVDRIEEKLATMPAPVARYPGSDAEPVPSAERFLSRRESGDERICVFWREGEYWTIGDDLLAVRLRDSVGLRHIWFLLGNPGREFAASDLIAEHNHCYVHQGDTGDVLDAQARANYRRRLAELREELEEAEAFHDIGRAARAQTEMGYIVGELSRAIGLGRRDRRSGSAAERARVNVTRTIHHAIRRIREHAPDLGGYLASTIRTGGYCSYVPDGLRAISWKLQR